MSKRERKRPTTIAFIAIGSLLGAVFLLTLGPMLFLYTLPYGHTLRYVAVVLTTSLLLGLTLLLIAIGLWTLRKLGRVLAIIYAAGMLSVLLSSFIYSLTVEPSIQVAISFAFPVAVHALLLRYMLHASVKQAFAVS